MAIDIRSATGPVLARASRGEDAVTVLCGVALVGGVLADAWAHTNRLSTLESFFTPRRALLYLGFAALAGWTVVMAYRRRSVAPRWWRDGRPAGYRLGVLGAAVFLLGGVGDLTWHQVFGIEVWPVELWTGTLVLTVLLGATLGALATAPAGLLSVAGPGQGRASGRGRRSRGSPRRSLPC